MSFFSPYIGSLPGVSSLRLVQAGFFSLSVGWDQPSSPVQGYRLTYGPRGQAHAYLCFGSLSISTCLPLSACLRSNLCALCVRHNISSFKLLLPVVTELPCDKNQSWQKEGLQ